MTQFEVYRIGPEIKIGAFDISFTNASLFMVVSSIAIMIILCLAFIVKSLEYGKYYSRLELAAASFEDLEEETNSGH